MFISKKMYGVVYNKCTTVKADIILNYFILELSRKNTIFSKTTDCLKYLEKTFTEKFYNPTLTVKKFHSSSLSTILAGKLI